jgi:hypothetical protein
MFIIRLLQINVPIFFFTAVAFIAFPDLLLSFYGISRNDVLRSFMQYQGVLWLAFAVLLFQALRLNDKRFLRIIVASFFVWDLSGSIILLISQLRGSFPPIGWSMVAFSVFLAIGYGYGFFRKLP